MLLQSLGDLFARYRQIFSNVWSIRHELTPPQRSADELAFLPAALELQDAPPHPAARITLWALLGFIVIAILWACIGKIDVVAVAPGKLIVSDQSKTVQSLDAGTVKAIHVRDGQVVKAGQLLIELDSTLAGAESHKNLDAWIEARLDILRAQALITGLNQARVPVLLDDPALKSAPNLAVRRAATQQEMLSNWQELQAKLATVDADTTRKQAERNATVEQVKKLEQTLPIVRQREADFNDLANKNFISKHGVLDKQQARIEAEQDLASQRSKLAELSAGIQANSQQAAALKAEFSRVQNDLLAQAQERAAALGQDVIKAQQLQKQTQLTAPVDGVVQQLAIHTVGGVVTPAQALMVIVPQGQQLEAQAILANKDIGFVNVGQHAAVKIETFNFTKYGLLDGQVSNVSLDAIPDEKLGLVYQAKVKLQQTKMNIDGRWVNLAPGMAVSVEVKTGQRRIIEYFLSPLIVHVSESVRER
ncbi:HlyD family type I secretion periplasmic adaptor subunit [Chitinibacter sp. SCUT-21]|uniref:HlyD family type I secretion periplasmic adaptor subunit n=1 Tax=Chitinibacter sp. SCUT-21 TaxID=2970891 RepID=UPI0035A623F5